MPPSPKMPSWRLLACQVLCEGFPQFANSLSLPGLLAGLLWEDLRQAVLSPLAVFGPQPTKCLWVLLKAEHSLSWADVLKSFDLWVPLLARGGFFVPFVF